MTIDERELRGEIETLLRTLRAANDQPSAVAWMKKAYVAMEACLRAIEERPQSSSLGTLVYVRVPPKLVIAQSIPKRAPTQSPRVWYEGETVVYPEMPMPPSLAAPPRPFTISDSRKLAAQTEAKRRIQRLGR